MKKLLCLLVMMLMLVGCGATKSENVINDFKKDVTKSKAYLIKGSMKLINDEDTFTYDIEAAYKKDDLYRVSLINKINNHEQIILKNESGVYVITPSLNKSFKFQSDWPNNSSQAYLLSTLVNDLEVTTEPKLEQKNKKYIVTADVDYPNNPSLKYEKIYFSKDMVPEKVEVYSEDDNLKIEVVFKSIDYKATFKDNYFELDSNLDEDCCKEEIKEEKNEETTKEEDLDDDLTEENKKKNEKTEETAEINDIIYPLYIPTNTYLSTKDVINVDSGQRAILTFSGDKSFILVQEPVSIPDEFEIIPVYGEPYLLNDSYGALSANSLTWITNNKEYYLSSNKLTSEEILNIASSLSNNNTELVSK